MSLPLERVVEGLYLPVSPAGPTRWFLTSYRDGKVGSVVPGSCPVATLPAATKACNASKVHKFEGSDPVSVRKLEKLKATRTDGDAFNAIGSVLCGLMGVTSSR